MNQSRGAHAPLNVNAEPLNVDIESRNRVGIAVANVFPLVQLRDPKVSRRGCIPQMALMEISQVVEAESGPPDLSERVLVYSECSCSESRSTASPLRLVILGPLVECVLGGVVVLPDVVLRQKEFPSPDSVLDMSSKCK